MRQEELEAKRATEWLSFVKRCEFTSAEPAYRIGRRGRVVWPVESQFTAKIGEEVDHLPEIGLDTLLAAGAQSVLYLFGEEGAARLVQDTDGGVAVDAVDAQGRTVIRDASLLKRDQRIKLSDNSIALSVGSAVVNIPVESFGIAPLLTQPNMMRTTIHLGRVVGVLVQQTATDSPTGEQHAHKPVSMLPRVAETIARYRAIPGFIRPEVGQR